MPQGTSALCKEAGSKPALQSQPAGHQYKAYASPWCAWYKGQREKRGNKGFVLKVCIYLCYGGTGLLCLACLFLLFNVSCSHAGWSTPNSVEEDAAKSFLKEPDICCCKADGICKQPVLKQISVSGHQEAKPQARTWKNREWAGKELAVNLFADPDLIKTKPQFQWQRILVSSLISVGVSLKCLNLSAWTPFTETVLNCIECQCAVI